MKKYFFVLMALLVFSVQTADVEWAKFNFPEIDKDRIRGMHFISTEPVKPLGLKTRIINFFTRRPATPSPTVEGQGLDRPSFQVPIEQNPTSSLTPEEIKNLEEKGASALFLSRPKATLNDSLRPEIIFDKIQKALKEGVMPASVFDYNGRESRYGNDLIDALAELLFHKDENVRVKAKSYLEASKDAYPDQVNGILNLYNEFLLLQKQIADITNNPTHTNSAADNKLVRKEILIFIHKVRYQRLDQNFKEMIINRVSQQLSILELVEQGKWTVIAPERTVPDPVIKKPESDFSAELLKDSLFPDMDIHNFQTLDDQQKQDLKKRLSNDGYFKLEVGAFKQNLEMFLKRGKSSAFYKDKQKQETFLSDISRQKLAYNNLIESLKELHDDAFFEQQKSNLKPLYDQLLDFENKIKKSQGILKFTRGLLKENGLKVLKKLKLIKAPKITQPDPIEVFLKDPLLFLQNESYTIRNQLRRFQTMNKGESLNQQLETLKAQIGKISLKQAKIKLAQCENEQKVLEEYKVLYDTYTFLSVSESCAFEKTVNAEGKVVPLTNEAVVRFIATSLGIGLLDVFSLPRQELYDKLIGTGKTKDKVVGENVEKPDQRYRNLSHVLSNDFLWALELQKLEGHPISIDHVHAERQLLNFLESYPNLNQAGHMESIDALIKEIRTGLKFPVEEPVAAQDNDHFFDAFETLPVESEPSMPDDKGDVFHDPVELLSADQDFVQTPPPSISIIEEEPTVDEPPALSKVRSGDDSNEEFHDALPLETAPADPVEELPLPGGFLLKDINEFAIQVEGKLPIRFTNKEKQLSDINLISKEMIEIFKILTTPKQNGRSPRIAEVKKEFTEKLSQLNFFTIPKPTLEQKRPAVIDVEICNFLQINSHVLEKLQPDLEKLKPDLKE